MARAPLTLEAITAKELHDRRSVGLALAKRGRMPQGAARGYKEGQCADGACETCQDKGQPIWPTEAELVAEVGLTNEAGPRGSEGPVGQEGFNEIGHISPIGPIDKAPTKRPTSPRKPKPKTLP